MFFVP